MDISSELPPSPKSPMLECSSNLRFPVVIEDTRFSSWVANVSASQTMTPCSEHPSDDGMLGESAYEYIDTDEESRDDNNTESLASTDFDRPDDVASMVDTEHSIEDSADEGDVPEAQQYSDRTVEDAFNTPTIARSSHIVVDDVERPLAQAIEFEESFSVGVESVCVKHTITEFNEEETTNILGGMDLQNPPTRIAVTIRQTMSNHGLITRDPLRILYVGSHAAKQDIIHKIASSVTASVESRKRSQHLRYSTSQLYTVVPVSEFGSQRTPEIELMHSSGYQINVEDCNFASSLKYEDNPAKPDIIKLILDDVVPCHSVPAGDGFTIEPFWELPHLAIFYCTDCDDIDARRTRSLARIFMSRHSVPSIVISHQQLFDLEDCMTLDQHSIHMCLESRESNGRGGLIHQRLPIDLASFLNIDARQMNLNLAYLTGLHGSLDSPIRKLSPKRTTEMQGNETLCNIHQIYKWIRTRSLGAGIPIAFILLSIFTAILTGIPGYNKVSVPAISINSKVMSAVSFSSTDTSVLSPTPTSTQSSVAIKTSTRTVTVIKSLAPESNSLSLRPTTDLGKAQGPCFGAVRSNKSRVCTAEILGDREVLIRIPSVTKLAWLNQEAFSINITRYNVTIDTERAYSSNEGIILLLPKRDAYGIVNISIITTKKPRVNETFQLDFGSATSQSWQNFRKKVSALLPNDPKLKAQFLAHLWAAAEKKAGATINETRSTSAKVSKEASLRVADAQKALLQKMQGLKHLRKPLDQGIFSAQVRSKILWLRIRGKDSEARNYGEQAAEAIRRHKKSHLRGTSAEKRQLKFTWGRV